MKLITVITFLPSPRPSKNIYDHFWPNFFMKKGENKIRGSQKSKIDKSIAQISVLHLKLGGTMKMMKVEIVLF